MKSSPTFVTRVLLGLMCSAAVASADPLESGFANPPESAKPQTWWHWMNGNITKAGITADLEAMKQIGLGGATIVNVDCGIPRGGVNFLSPEWREDFKFAVSEASRLGLELCVENCAGWSSSGGPWNTVTNAMQRVTVSEVRVTGPTNFNATLPQPPTTLGFYRDIAVLAFPAPAEETVRMKDSLPQTSTSSQVNAGKQLTDGNVQSVVRLPLPQRGHPQFAQLEFAQPFPTRTVKIVGGAGMPECSGELLVSDDGKNFQSLKSFAFSRRGSLVCLLTLGAKPVSARYWRVQFTSVASRALPAAKDIPLAEIELAPRLTIENLDAKAGFNGNEVLSDREAVTTTTGAVQRRAMIDLTTKLSANGQLTWGVPAGEWVIQRFGFTPTGRNNHPAPKEGEGLECDKFSKTALDAHWDGFMKVVLGDIGPQGTKTLNTSLIDSYEVGGQNWNAGFRDEFRQRRGYDLLKYLPTFAGRVVDSPLISERFLWDVRRTIADLIAENYFGHFAELCQRNGLLNAVEPYTGPFESMQSGAPADVVMGEFWSGSAGHPSVKLAASIAHVYGKSIVAAESFTASPEPGRWQNDPYSLKTLGDLMFCQGLNRYVFHRYAMQPWTNTWPGMTMGQWGFHFERTVTWWNQGKPWIDYISRAEFLLQQGRAVADVAYFTGESAPSEMRLGNPALPAGYDYDAINADVLLHGASVKNGRLMLASGASYAALVLPPNDSDLTPRLLASLDRLVRSGATLIGPRPQHSPSLTDYPECDKQVQRLAEKLWGACDGKNILENPAGQGRIVWGKSLNEVLAEQKLKPDFEFTGNSKASKLAYCHRRDGAAEIYFVSNQRQRFDSLECTFRVDGKIPELWHPETGVTELAPIWSTQEGRTKVRLDLQPAESVFVIFRQATGTDDQIISSREKLKSENATQPKLEILSATYAAIDGTAKLDVTARIAELVRDGQTSILANNDTFGRDPAFNHEKELRVEYTLNGQPGQLIAHENDALNLPLPGFGASPAWQASVDSHGETRVKFWADGQVDLQLASGRVRQAKCVNLPAEQRVSDGWKLKFPPNWGAPAEVALGQLISWTDHTNDGVRYFSGTATYEKNLDITGEQLAAGRELWLDLGTVKNFAEVSLNGQSLGVLWKPPFRVNLTGSARPGTNQLVVKVTNLWPNRLIGDEQLPDDREWNGKQLKGWPQWFLDGKPSPTGRLTFTTWHHWTKSSPLLESGLIGPVILRTAAIITAK